MLAWLTDLIIAAGLLIMTTAVYGMVRLPNLYTRLHAASKAGFLGIIPFLLAATTTGEPGIAARLLLITLLLTLTTPVAAHAIGRSAFLRGERLEGSGSIDESGHDLAERR
ncbi:MAG: monovalent cation/H(+) antiporter subunit G [Chloroflexi bacterium]|nr:monovalent cation/H(+) antiporter subunit G [Chloroflexota bacterium]